MQMTRTTIVRKAAAIAVALVALTVAFVAGTGSAATATQGQPVIAGQGNSQTSFTSLTSLDGTNAGGLNVLANGSGFGGIFASQGGYGVIGSSYPSGVGVLGSTGTYSDICCQGWSGDGVHGLGALNGVSGETANNTASGVYGQNNGSGYGTAGRATNGTGVFGEGLIGVLGNSLGAGDGVDGTASNSCCSAVYGLNSGTGNGVAGRADTGTGVLAASTSGTALKVSGKAQFSRSGLVTITYPAKSKVITGVPLTAKSLVLATQQKFLAGVYVVAAVPNLSGSSNSFTIYLSKAPGTSAVPKSVTVAWQVIERP
jgi:hypothetical protein